MKNNKEAAFLTSAASRSGYPSPTMAEIAFAGRSNVGKTSLINCLLGKKKLAKISATPGKTRLLNFYATGRGFRLVDLPGYGYARVPEWVKEEWGTMVEEYLATRERLTGVVLVLDIRRQIDQRECDLLDFLRDHTIPEIVVTTKADKLSRNELLQRQKLLWGDLRAKGVSEVILFSSTTGMGRSDLWAKILETVGPDVLSR